MRRDQQSSSEKFFKMGFLVDWNQLLLGGGIFVATALSYVIGNGTIGYLAFAAIFILFITISNTLYFNIVKNSTAIKRFAVFGVGVIISLIVCVVLIMVIQHLLYETPAKMVVEGIDKVIYGFASLIKLPYLIAWFGIPIALAFIYYAVLSVYVYISEYKAWIKWNDQQAQKINGGSDSNSVETPQKNHSVLEILKNNLRIFKKHSAIKHKIIIREEDITSVPYKEPLKLMKCCRLSKKGQLQLGMTDSGYVMVVNSLEHDNKLREFTHNVHDDKKVPDLPYIVFFDNDTFTAKNVKEYGRELISKQKDKQI